MPKIQNCDPHRAVFIPPGSGPRVLFGKDGTGNLVHVQDAQRGLACNLTCPDCDGPLIANKGKIKAAYFSHQSRVECEHAGESALHLMAKEIIEEQGSLNIPEVSIWRFREGVEILQPAMTATFNRVEVEPRQNGFQPDLIGIKEIVKNGRSLVARLHIEIYVTHKVDELKLRKFRDLDESALEIDLSGIDRAISRSELSEILQVGDNKEWLYHRSLQKALDAEVEKENQRQAEALSRSEFKRQRTAAILEAQEKSLLEDPDPITARQRAFVESEWCNWRSVNMDMFLDVPADDRYFSVDSRVWRAAALSSIAPWNGNSKGWMKDERKSDLPGSLSSDFRKMGWIKSPFASLDLKRFCSQRRKLVPWDPAADEVRRILGFVIQYHRYPKYWSEGDCLEKASQSISEKYDAFLNKKNRTGRPETRLKPRGAKQAILDIRTQYRQLPN